MLGWPCAASVLLGKWLYLPELLFLAPDWDYCLSATPAVTHCLSDALRR